MVTNQRQIHPVLGETPLEERIGRYEQSYHPPIPGKHVPLIVRNNVLVDLNTLIAPNSGFTVADAIGINDSGQILCNASNTTGNAHAVMLAPPH